jgi:hypothetical protein
MGMPMPHGYDHHMHQQQQQMHQQRMQQHHMQMQMRQQQHMQMHAKMQQQMQQQQYHPKGKGDAPAAAEKRTPSMTESKEALRRNKQQVLSQLMNKRMEWAQALIKGQTADGKALDGPARAALKTKLDAASKQIDVLRKETEVLEKAQAAADRIAARKQEDTGMNAAGQPPAAPATEAPVKAEADAATATEAAEAQ